MGNMLGGLEARMKLETDGVKEQLGVAVDTIGDLGTRVEKAERRLEGLADEVNTLVDKRLGARAAVSGELGLRPTLSDSGSLSYATAVSHGSMGSESGSPGPDIWILQQEGKNIIGSAERHSD